MIKHLLIFASSFVVMSCFAQENYKVGDPNDPTNYGYLKDYDDLKNYVELDKYPNFKLGIGTTVDDYLNKGLVYRLTNDNFTETVAGNAMKQASCVSNNGTMNFSKVKSYVSEATAAGLNVYGHTLAWHSQQAVGWLNSLIKDVPEPEIDGDVTTYVEIASKDYRQSQSVGWHSSESDFGYTLTFDSTNGLKVHTASTSKNYWDIQYVALDNIPTDVGTTYRMTMTIKGSGSGKLHSKLGDFSAGTTADISFSTAWKDVVVDYKCTVSGSFLLLQSGDFKGDIYIKKITFSKPTKGKSVEEERRCIVVKADEKVNDAWDNQFWIVTGSFDAGSSYEFSADVRSDKAASASTQIHSTPGTYVHYVGIGDVTFNTNWKTITSKGTFDKAGSSIAFNLNEYASANNYYFDNISLKINGVEKIKNGSLEGTDVSSFKVKIARGSVTSPTISDRISYIKVAGTIPLSDEVKHDTLVWAMDKWISGMMAACEGKVKAWDVVNEAISGGGADNEGVYALQHGSSGSSDFFWQDHMGDLEYARQAIRLARKYGPKDVKLFINDYNLEGDWDENGKLKSLIKWIERWESDGVTKVDGIGSQMHISCYMNDGTQESKKNGIEQMLKLMAETGKLVRISELDMGMVDASGKDVSTSDMTEEMHKRMADLYEWIIKKYLEIIPSNQQWGICLWCPTDSPSSSSWRPNMPVGIWTLGDYYRKHAYAGVAKGLGGGSTAIESVESDNMKKTPVIYSLNGSRISVNSFEELPNGIYIINGKKVKK